MVQHCLGGLDAILSVYCIGRYVDVKRRERNEVQRSTEIQNHDETFLHTSIYKNVELRRKMHWPTMTTDMGLNHSLINAIDH